MDQLTELIKGAILPSVESLTKLQAGQSGAPGIPYRSSCHRALGGHTLRGRALRDTEGIAHLEQTEAEITPMQGFKELLSPDEPA